MSVLEGVTRCPDLYVQKHSTYKDRVGSEYIYSTDVYDHAYLVDNYVEARYAETQTKTVYICMHCYSDNVQVQAWVRPNQGMQYVDEVAEGDMPGYCNDCDLSAVIETAEFKRHNTVIGFQVCGENDTKEEDKIHPHMESEKSVYSLDQANSMLDDDNNGDEQWQLRAIWTQDIEEPQMMFSGDPRNPDEMILP